MDSLQTLQEEVLAIAGRKCGHFQSEIIEAFSRYEAQLSACQSDSKDAERLDSGCIVLTHRDEFGEPYKCEYRGINLREAIDAAMQALSTPAQEQLTRCASNRDGECSHKQCPQIRDSEPAASGRHCPLDNWEVPD
jgi:hypothetical protein